MEPLELQPINKVIFKENGKDYDFGLYRVDAKSIEGFVFTWHENGYLRNIEVFDGVAPQIYYIDDFGKKEVIALRFIQGARQRIVRIYTLDGIKLKAVKNGEIYSNVACVLRLRDGSGDFGALYEVNRKYRWQVFRLSKTLKLLSDKNVSTQFLQKISSQCDSASF